MMYAEEYSGINSFLIGASNLLLKYGIKRETKGYTSFELPAPFLFKINNPRARYVTIPERQWNPILPFAEVLWLSTGRNDIKFISNYLKQMKDFSDDGHFLRGGYGPRMRKFSGVSEDYENEEILDKTCIKPNKVWLTDQLKFVIKKIKKNPSTRQAIINLGDPAKDCFESNDILKETKDFPCTRSLHFQKQTDSDKLDLMVHMRSNDLLWGASAVNIFNFTFIQEYTASILNLEIGNYYHTVNNFHYYKKFESKIEEISRIKDFKEEYFDYHLELDSLKEFDYLLKILHQKERDLRENSKSDLIRHFNNDFFNDWYKTFYCFNLRKKVHFKNPVLNTIFKKYMRHE